METIEKTVKGPDKSDQKLNVFIVDEDTQYVKTLKAFLEKEFHEHLDLKFFPTGESVVAEIKRTDKKPQIVLLDYLGNKPLNPASHKHTVDDIASISPHTGIIMMSDKKYEDRAMKALAYGAHDYVLKDKFSLDHVVNSVKKVLNPPKL